MSGNCDSRVHDSTSTRLLASGLVGERQVRAASSTLLKLLSKPHLENCDTQTLLEDHGQQHFENKQELLRQQWQQEEGLCCRSWYMAAFYAPLMAELMLPENDCAIFDSMFKATGKPGGMRRRSQPQRDIDRSAPL